MFVFGFSSSDRRVPPTAGTSEYIPDDNIREQVSLSTARELVQIYIYMRIVYYDFQPARVDCFSSFVQYERAPFETRSCFTFLLNVNRRSSQTTITARAKVTETMFKNMTYVRGNVSRLNMQ